MILTYKINVKVTNIIKHEEIKKKEVKKKLVTHLRMGSPQYQKKKIETSLERQLTKCSSDFDEKIKNKCFDNDSAHLYEPRSKILKIGQDTKFKVRIKGAKNVAVLDGRKWVYLRRKEDELYEGNVVIENENVIEENEFKKQIYDFGLVKKTKLSKINYKTLYETFLKYEKDMGIKHITLKIPDEEENKKEEEREKEKENESKEKSLEAISKISSIKAKEDDTKETDIKLEISSINENDIKGNIAEIIITQEDINKDIQIINSFENYLRREKSQQKEKYDDNLFNNEKEIKENVQIKIDENLIEFSYTYKFDK